MATATELIIKREKLRTDFLLLCQDSKEYTLNPVETVCIHQIRYQMDFVIREIRLIDDALKQYFLQQSESAKRDIQALDNLIETIESGKFSVSDLPKNHSSLWQNS